MDVPCSIQGNIHAFSLIINVSRNLGTYQKSLLSFGVFLKKRVLLKTKMNLKQKSTKKVTPNKKSLTNFLKKASRYFDEQDYKKSIKKAV